MIQVLIMSRQDAKKYSYQKHEKTSVVVSITDVESAFGGLNFSTTNGIKAVLSLRFNDVELGQVGCIEKNDAEKIAKFALYWKDSVDLIIVHCEAGISRSAGVAAAILKFFNNDDEQIFKSPYYRPNMSCYRMVLNALADAKKIQK